MKRSRTLAILLSFSLGIFACEELIPSAPADDSLLDGPVEGLSDEENRRFLRGDIAFNDDIFTA
ncbi:MAG TPA: hypothetical protein VK589_07625, partial [Chryseolinea sp.]|nr:hypothetical protein [Chryseolinea sp.]